MMNCPRFPAALREAEAVDSLLATDPDLDQLARDKPMLGVPFTTKDCMAVKVVGRWQFNS